MELVDCAVCGYCSTTVALSNNTSECKNLSVGGPYNEFDSLQQSFIYRQRLSIQLQIKYHNRLYSSKDPGTLQRHASAFSRLFQE